MKKHPKIPPPTPIDLPLGGLTQHQLSQMKDVQAELAERRLEAVRLWSPMPKQEEFHACMASERLVIGGNRCLAGSQMVYDPVAKVFRRVDQIGGEFWVESLEGGKRITARAKAPYAKAEEPLYAFILSNGQEIRCSLDHLVLSTDDEWTSLRAALLPECVADLEASTLGTCRQESPEGDLRWCQTPEGFRAC